MTEDATRRKLVTLYLSRPDDFLRTHEGITLVAVPDAIARLKHYRSGAARSVTHCVLRRADHGLSRASFRKAYGKILEDWFRKTR